jgi:glutamate racemase
MDRRPIGVFDSGLGGLTVVKEILKMLPNEDIVYLGDTARVPYGTRSKRTIKRFAREDIDFLNNKDTKCIIVACNTVSSVAIHEVRKFAKVKVFDVVTSGIEEILREDKKRVGLIATRATVNSRAYETRILKLNNNITIESVAAPLLIPLIEEGEISGKILDLVLEKYLKQFKKEVELIILGCTHFPIIEARFNAIRPEVEVINPAKRLAIDVKNYLSFNKSENTSAHSGRLNINVTDLGLKYKEVASIFLGMDITSITKKVRLKHFDD